MHGGIYQHNADRLGILRVQPEHVYGEGDLVGYPLAWRLYLRPKLQVFVSIVCSLAVLVMNVFYRKKPTPQLFLHDKGVFESFAATGAVPGVGISDADISLLVNSPLNWSIGSRTQPLVFCKFIGAAALGAAQRLLTATVAIRPALNWDGGTTYFAVGLHRFIWFASPLTAAFRGTVERIAAMFFAIATQFSRTSYKRGAAHFASKSHTVYALNASVMCVIAGTRAEFPLVVATLTVVELFSAIQTGFHKAISFVFGHMYHSQYEMATGEGIQ